MEGLVQCEQKKGKMKLEGSSANSIEHHAASESGV